MKLSTNFQNKGYFNSMVGRSNFTFLLLFFFATSIHSQIEILPCQDQGASFIGLDRNNFTGGTTGNLSEGHMHNFTLPTNTFGDCKKISNVEIDFTFTNVDISGLPGDCAIFDFFINFSDGCPLFDPASCNFIFNQIQGFPVSQTVNFTCPPQDFDFGDNFGVDVVPAMANTSCSVGQSTISTGSIILEYEICITVTIIDEMIDTPPDLGTDQSTCPMGTTTLDPGSYMSYVWGPNGEVTPMIDVGPGNYSVTVTDFNGCTGEDEIMLFPFPDSGITFDPAIPNVCDNGMVSVSVNETYSLYQWSNNSSGQTVNLSTGMYDVTITDSNNCTAVNSISIMNVAPPNAGIDNFIDVCNDGTAYNIDELLTIHDPGGNWTDNDGSGVDINLNPNATDFLGVTPGSYQFTYSVTGSVPCPSDQAIITIEVYEQNNAGTSETVQLCSNPGDLDFNLLINNPDLGGIWSDIDFVGVDLTNPFSVNFNGIPAGTYNFEYLLISNGACSEQTSILTIVILESAFAGLDNITTVCEGTQFDLLTLIDGANGSGTFFDSDGSGALSGSFVNTTGLAGQSYNFTFIVGSTTSPCGQDEAIFTVNIETSLSAGDNATSSLCTDGQIDLFDVLNNEDQGGFFIDVNSSGGLSGSILDASVIAPGTYVYQYTVGDGITCPEDVSDISITFFEDPSYNFLFDELSLCENQCEDIQINFSGAPPFNFPVEIVSSTTGEVVASTNISINTNEYTFTTCNLNGTIGFVNDTLNLITDSTWFLSIPMINDVNCAIGSDENSDSLIISTFSNSFFQLDTSACITDTIVINGVMLFDGNETYIDTIPGINCDSIININASFQENEIVMIDTTICLGDSIMLNGMWFNEGNPSIDINVVNPNGCDSLIMINISFFPISESVFNPTLCNGDSIEINGTVYNNLNPSGTEVLIGQSMNGCDSTIMISLDFDDDIMQFVTDTLCIDGSIEIGGMTFDMSNPSGQITLFGSGCDTIVNIDLSFHEIADSLISGVFCPDFSVEINGTIYDINNSSGNEILVNMSQFGCDSIIDIDLAFQEIADSLISGLFCSDFSIDINGTIYDNNNSTGNEVLANMSQLGCDSIVVIDLAFYSPATSNYNPEVCDNESIDINGTIYNAMNASGVEIIPNGSINGCDSTVNIQLDINQSFDVPEFIGICDGDSIFLAGNWQFVAGVYIDNFMTVNMCDSIVTTTLTIISCTVDVELSVINNECANDSLGSITIDMISNIPVPFNIMWEGTNSGTNGMQMIVDNQNPVVLNNLVSDNYTITIRDNLGTILYQSTIAILDSNPEISGDWIVIDSIYCAGDLGTLEFQAMGGVSSYNYNWDPTDIGDSPIAQDVNAGEYFLTVTDQLGCTMNTTFTFTEPQPFIATVSTLQLSCTGSSDGQISISDVSGGVAPYVVTLNNQVLDSFEIMGLDTGFYQIELVDANNCSISFLEELTSSNNSNFGAYTESYTIQEGDSITIDGSVIGQNLNFEWSQSDGSLSCVDCPNPVANPSITTVYTLEISDSLGCSQLITINVEVEQKESINIHPNVFSPNGDNSNDDFSFKINNNDVIGMNMSIYDRWGNLVFNDITVENEILWDGTRNGKTLTIGVYVYNVVIQYEDGNSEIVFGDLLLID